MGGGYEVDPESLAQASKGINGVIEELRDLGVVGTGDVPDVAGLEQVVVDRGPDPQDPRTERFRAVWARLV